MNDCTFLLLRSLSSQVLKDCRHNESISLYNVHNSRALVQHCKVEQRLFNLLVLVTAFIKKPPDCYRLIYLSLQNVSAESFCHK